jgi:hypothetical protein
MNQPTPRPGRPSKGRTVKRTLRTTPEVAEWLAAESTRRRKSVDDMIEDWALGLVLAEPTPGPVPTPTGEPAPGR